MEAVVKIESEVVIEAPLARVWSLVAEPGWWVGKDHPTDVELRPGDLHVASNKTDGTYPIQVVAVEEQSYVAFRWAPTSPGAAPNEHNSTLIEFTVNDEGDRMRVTVVESGFETLNLPEEASRRAVELNTAGWRSELDDLRSRATS
jgi:uncharacterized protein YndB with AHSA1/START domain